MRTAHCHVGLPAGLRAGAFSLIECIVSTGVLMVIMALLATAYYHADWNNRNLTRNADDILRTLKAGEQWREDVRTASGPIQFTAAADGPELSIPHGNQAVRYAFRQGAVWRQTGATARWQEALGGVLKSRMEKDPRRFATAWRWELELKTRPKAPRLRPLFFFEAAVKETKP